jgi:hypothetical protein
MPERTTVRLPAELIKRAKRKAAAERRSLTALIEEGLRRVVSEPQSPGPEEREPLPVSSTSGGLAPGLEWDELKALQDLEDIEDVRRLS